MLHRITAPVALMILLAAGSARAQDAPPAPPDSAASTLESIEDLRQELNAALADLSARLNEVRNRQSQASVDGVLFLRWSDDLKKTPGFNEFGVDRAYLNVRGSLNRRGVYRLTLDAERTTGERLFDYVKYAYDGVVFSPSATVLLGMQQTPLVDFEEGIWKYRFVQKVLSDNEGKLTSSDLGLGAEGILNRKLAYKVLVSNGEGYKKAEADRAKDLAGRLTYTVLPGLRLSAFANYGLIDTSKARAASLVRHRYAALLSYEQPRYTVLAQALGAEDQSRSDAQRVQSGGVSLGGSWEAVSDWRLFGRFDMYDPDRLKPDNAHFRGLLGVSYAWGSNMVVALSNQWTTYGALATDKPTRPDGKTYNPNQVALQVQVTY
ncbi:MAG: hypothetical protein HZB25_12695 [Candidatus Eisenbacteria bacterium]|nr:hypothetical protein [Candidatus Eisenbacteria bacterium]